MRTSPAGPCSTAAALGLALALTFRAAVPTPAAAQDLALGVTGGLSIASLGGADAADDLGSRTGINAGAFLDFPVTDIIGLVPGVSYVQKGAVPPGFDVLAIDYIEFPLLLRVSVSTREPVGVHLLLGPTFAFQVRCEAVTPTATVRCEEDGAPALDLSKSFDLGAAFGGGVSFALSPAVSFLGTALWDLGITSIDDSPANREVRNEAILLNVGLVWRPGR